MQSTNQKPVSGEAELKLEGLCIVMPQVRQGKDRENNLKQNESGKKQGWKNKTNVKV